MTPKGLCVLLRKHLCNCSTQYYYIHSYTIMESSHEIHKMVMLREDKSAMIDIDWERCGSRQDYFPSLTTNSQTELSWSEWCILVLIIGYFLIPEQHNSAMSVRIKLIFKRCSLIVSHADPWQPESVFSFSPE